LTEHSHPTAVGESRLSAPAVGTRVSLESTRLTGRMWSTLVGWRSDGYLLLETPEHHIPPGITTAFSAEDVLTVRFMSDGLIVGFRAPVIGRISHPVGLTVVAWPAQVQTHSLRRDPRLACYLPCRISAAGRSLGQAVVVDISLHGCCVRLSAEAQVEEDVLAEDTAAQAGFTPDERIELEVPLPEADGSVTVTGRLVSVEQPGRHYVLRVASDAPLQRLVDFVGMFVTRMNVQSS
jgi:hypothetical protein